MSHAALVASRMNVMAAMRKNMLAMKHFTFQSEFTEDTGAARLWADTLRGPPNTAFRTCKLQISEAGTCFGVS